MNATQTDPTIPTIQTLAKGARAWFENATRRDEDATQFVRTKDGTPEWVRDLVHEAHGDMFPDDFRYEMIRDALDYIVESDADADESDLAHEFADSEVSVYNAERTRWLASNLRRAQYVDDACDELGKPDDLFTQLGYGWYEEAREVFELVWIALQAKLDEDA